jgi:predicted glycoside hydrolase/deacetylase ChbG (UPF0249 family)
MARQLIFNADDYGLSPGVSAGIREAMRAGLVRSTTVMSNLVTREEVGALLDLLSSCGPCGQPHGFSVGCHLNLSCGIPIEDYYPEELRRREGADIEMYPFDKATALHPATWRNRKYVEAAVNEWGLQLSNLLMQDLPITHLDSHHHMHLLPELFTAALQLAREHGLAIRIRRSYRSLARTEGVSCPDDMLEGYYGVGKLDQASLLSMLDNCQADDGQVIEVMCHPAQVDDLLRQRSGYLAEREEELATLTDPRLPEVLAGRGWELASYVAVSR